MPKIEDRLDWPNEGRQRLVMLSGCSGGGKSTLLAELEARGLATCPEPGRQIVCEQSFIDGPALPWVDMSQFIELVVSRSLQQAAQAIRSGEVTIFDRGLVDAYAYFEREGLAVPSHIENAVRRLRYADRVFLAPPWPEIFASDAERRHGFDAAVAEYQSLLRVYAALGYELVELPRASVAARADFVMGRLAGA
ncbi:AAA family ATPase [Kaistia granuli]|uniref:AAA family ATPase n=1 Tax=Kaistia granuli TaxID=363259 RepID=UPI000377DC99|nr:AAA family ATPase [Kaistia granuli]